MSRPPNVIAYLTVCGRTSCEKNQDVKIVVSVFHSHSQEQNYVLTAGLKNTSVCLFLTV